MTIAALCAIGPAVPFLAFVWLWVTSDLDRDRRERRRDVRGTTEKHERIRKRDRVETEEQKAQRRRQQGGSMRSPMATNSGSSRRVTPVVKL